MGWEHFVGRLDAVSRLRAALTGQGSARGGLAVQSIEGPGGIGKTYLLDHVLATTDLCPRNYLILRVNAHDPDVRSLVRIVSRMMDGAQADAIRSRPAGSYFLAVDRVIREIEAIRREALAEFQRLKGIASLGDKEHPSDEEGQSALLRFLDLAFEGGKLASDAVPIIKKYVNVRELQKAKQLIEKAVPLMRSLRVEAPWFWEHLGLGGSCGLRNAIKENACRPLADELVTDLSAILAGYGVTDWLTLAHWQRPTHSKVPGIDRLLLIVDDYEVLQEPLGEFLVGHLLPSLRLARFQSLVVILVRDDLTATHTAWDRTFMAHLEDPIKLAPLSRPEMDQLVESYGVLSQGEKERAWRDTQGYPFYVQLWIEEIRSGGRSAVALGRFYDRTTCWMNEKQKGWLHQTLFLDEVNVGTLRKMLGGEAEDALKWFKDEGSVRDTATRAYRVREYLRSRLIDYLTICDPDRCAELQRRGQEACGRQPR